MGKMRISRIKNGDDMDYSSKNVVTRRVFLSNGAAAGAAVVMGITGCSRSKNENGTIGTAVKSAHEESVVKKPPAHPLSNRRLPLVQAVGSSSEIGEAIGAATRERIIAGIEARREWFEDMKKFAFGDRASRLDAFVQAIEKFHPFVLAEIKGIARGARLPLDDILILNLQTELGALKSAAAVCDDACSTLHLVDGNRIFLAHNEDGHDAYRDLMVVVHQKPTGHPAFTGLMYPGVIQGNVPAVTDAGLVMTTNFIGAAEVKPGIPRYVLGRAALCAKNLDQSIKIATDKESAYSFHLNLGSIVDKRLLAVDVAGDVSSVKETKGIFLQTNHFVLDGMKDIAQPGNLPGKSSDSRYRTLAKALDKLPSVDRVGKETLIELLSSHQAVNQPYSPCRHPDENSKGRTLATALFDLTDSGSFTLFEGNPCEGNSYEIDI
jgi:Acyl-coenzyme A:6-aminopenicillanic acid acyl-transferase